MNIEPGQIHISEYNYPLPSDRIAVFPHDKRDHSKLLVYKSGKIMDEHFYDLPHQLPETTQLIANDTRVIEARIHFTKSTGGTIEIFCLEPFRLPVETALARTAAVQWVCLIGGASKWKPGQLLEKIIVVNDVTVSLTAKYVDRYADAFIIEFTWSPAEYTFSEIIHQAGEIPLPPYIKRAVTLADRETYQTIFSRYEGSVAAPTAALHFTTNVFDALKEKNITIDHVTLHVGAGTFKPVKTETIAGHQMHEEPFTVSKQTIQHLLYANNVVAVGTTTLRTLESLHWIGIKLLNGQIGSEWVLGQWEAYELAQKYSGITSEQSLQSLLNWMEQNNQPAIHCRTSVIIVPGYPFQLTNGLITNFHQPQSTLLLLVSAFIGDDWKKVYQHALDNNYRFLSYGDSSLLWRND